ncbi:MAG: protein translocase subunit SecF [Oscillospiraceae bacterium]|nr:protein translocase subunit SecF [Oscillospiraceae bacterium]
MSKANSNKPVSTAKTYNFCGKRKMIAIITALVIIVAAVGIIVRGLKVAIEFKGGTMISYTYTGDIDVNEAQSIISGIVDTSVNVRSGESFESGSRELTVSFTSDTGLTADRQTQLTDALQENFAEANLQLYDSNDVSPTTGKEFFLKCLVAMVLAAVLIIIYIAIRFRKIGGVSAGLCSVLALLHDLVVAFAASVLFGFEFNSNMVAVILTILGYSINNTIVIYDRIRENRQLMPKASMNDIINAGCSQSLTRSIRTSITTIGTMLIVTIVVMVSGYDSLLSFSVPLLFGLISGTYSSLFVAPVTWSWWMEKKAAKEKK